jgi:hypothetical protein
MSRLAGWLAAFAFAAYHMAGLAAEPYAVQRLVLFQPDFVLKERTDAEALAAYVKALEASTTAALAHRKPTPTAGFLVVAVRPGGTSKVWLDFDPPLPAPADAELRSALEHVKPFSARVGVVVFAIEVTLWGAAPTPKETPWPSDWKAAVDRHGSPLETGDLVDLAWPEKIASDCAVVYQRGGPPGPYDAKVHAALDDRYRIEDIDPDQHHYENPKPVSGAVPPPPSRHDGGIAHGFVSLAYVITAHGTTESPTVIHTDGPELTRAAREATLGFRFDPAKVEGKAACIVSVQEFNF